MVRGYVHRYTRTQNDGQKVRNKQVCTCYVCRGTERQPRVVAKHAHRPRYTPATAFEPWEHFGDLVDGLDLEVRSLSLLSILLLIPYPRRYFLNLR